MSKEIKKDPLNEEEEKIIFGGMYPNERPELGARFWCSDCNCEVVYDGTFDWARAHSGHQVQYLG